MWETNKHPIREEWEEYYQTLENIRQMNVCNMWAAHELLEEFYKELTPSEAKNILLSWIANYNKLKIQFNW